jgi:hypothetical protein
MARFVKAANHMGADEARGTGDENRKRGHAGQEKSTSHQSDQALEMFQGQLLWPESHHAPTGQRRLEVFLKVGSESRWAVVATIDVDAALDLDERAGIKVGKVSSPFSNRMKSKFLFQFRAVQFLPQQFKTLF